MRKVSSLVLVMALTLMPILAQGSGCLSQHSVVGTVHPVKAPPPTELPAKGAPLEDDSMHPLTLLLWLIGGTLGLCMLGALTHGNERSPTSISMARSSASAR